jgi:hypothetical protein
MRRMGTRLTILVAAISIVSCVGATANDLGFSARIGLEITYTPIPPTSFNIGSDLTLAFDVSGFSFVSETGFDLVGFQSQRVTLGVDLGVVRIGEQIRFEPTFSWNELSLDLAIVGVNIGVDWILASIGGVQTPTYSMGAVLHLSSGIVRGFSISSLTGFGAIDLVNALDGIEAPFSHELLYLFHHLATLCAPPIELDVTIVSGFYFEEELVRVEVDYLGLIASNTTWFDSMGLSRLLFELGYRFEEPSLSFLATMTLDGSFAIIGMEFIVDLQMDPVRFTSRTTFTEATLPSPVPIIFGGQGFAVSFQICGVTITSQTEFDSSFFFAEERIAIEAEIAPVTFSSLTVFDAFGFASECVYADVTFSGIVLFTRAEFDFTGIQEVTFGFALSF